MNNPVSQLPKQAITVDTVKQSLEFFRKSLKDKFDKHFKSKETIDRNGVVTKPFILRPPGVNTLSSSFIEVKKLRSLRPKHLKIIHLYLSGKFKIVEIAEILNTYPSFVSMVINSVPGQKMISDSYQESVQEFKALTSQAVGAFRDGLKSEALDTRLKTAKDFFKIAQKQDPQKIELEITEKTLDVKEKLFSKLGLDPSKLIELTKDDYS